MVQSPPLRGVRDILDRQRRAFLALFVLLLALGPGAADEQKESPHRVGEKLPFHVVDFVNGVHKGHGGCPSATSVAYRVVQLSRFTINFR